MRQFPKLEQRSEMREEAIRAHKKSGGRVAAVWPILAPRALFEAHGVLPVEVWGPPRVDTSHADAHLQAYTCDVVRKGLSFLLSGGLEAVDMVVVPHGCDSLQGLGSILPDFTGDLPVLTFYHPRRIDGHAVDYLTAELTRLHERLMGITGIAVSDERLLEEIGRDEAAGRGAQKFFEDRLSLPHSNRELYEVVRCREFLPGRTFAQFLEAEEKRRMTNKRSAGIRLVLSGVLPEPMCLLDALDELGGLIVGDDTIAVGRRFLAEGASTAPLKKIAEQMVGAPADSSRGSSIDARRDHLLALVNRTGAAGVVFHQLKFCEPEQFYLPALKRGLEKSGIPFVVIEHELSDELSGQAATRIEAFMETLR